MTLTRSNRVLLAAVALTVLSAGSQNAAAETLTLYCSVQEEWCQAMVNAFTAETGIEVAMIRKSSGETYAQIQAQSGNPKGDVWWGGTGDPHLQAAEEGLIEEYKSPKLAELHLWAQKQAESSKYRTAGIYAGALSFVYNIELLEEKKLPSPACWADLVKPEYKDEIQIANPNSSGTSYTALATLVQLLGEEPAFDYLEQLNANVNQYTKSGAAPATAAARGETAIGITFMHDGVTQVVGGFPVKVVAPCEGTGYEIGSMSIIKGGPNLEAAKTWYDWALSPKAQEIGATANTFQVPSNKGAATPPEAPSLDTVKLNGTVTLALADWFGFASTRWIYGLPGIMLTQTLAFTPIAFLVMIGIVQGISPALEEAAQMLRANRWQTFRRVTWPLLRPGLANAFLIGFIESLADFGNPLVLGGNYEVLSVKIFYAVVGTQHDPGRAAALVIVLLGLCAGAFMAQRFWLSRRSYTTISGKGDSGTPAELPLPLKAVIYSVTPPWAAFTFLLYILILFGGFVVNWGRDNSFTLKHYEAGFGIAWSDSGLQWTGRAWSSLFTTLEIAALSAPLTAAMGLLTAYLLVRQRFSEQGGFEFMTMLSFAIPGTVIGVSYILERNPA